MKQVICLLLFLIDFSLRFLIARSSNELSIALRNISRELYSSSNKVQLLKFVNDSNTIDHQVLRSAQDENVPVVIKKIPIQTYSPNFKQAIITIGSEVKIDSSLSYIIRHDIPVHDKVLYVHCFNASLNDITEYSKMENMKFTYFILEEKEFIKLLTIGKFPSKDCIKGELIEVNRFSKRSLKWKLNEFKELFLNDYHDCNLTIKKKFDTRANVLKKMLNLSLKSGSRHFEVNKKIYKELANHLKYRLVEDEKNYDLRIQPFLSDMFLKSLGCNFMRPYLYENFEFAVPVGKPYDGYEKLVLPFDEEVWYWILLTFAAAFVTIVILKFSRQSFRDFIIGRNVETPHLNVLMGIFGISQITVPSRNFARYLVIVFIIYCMIIRTAWQGKMFEFMQKDMRRPEVKSVEEIIEKRFTIFLEVQYIVWHKPSELLKNRLLQISILFQIFKHELSF